MGEKETESQLAEALNSEALSTAIVESPIFRIMQRNIIKQTYFGGVIMAAVIVGMWNLINALQIDPVVSGSASLLVGLVLFFFQIRSLFIKPKSPPKKGTFPCRKCGADVPFDATKEEKGYADELICPKCGQHYTRNNF